MFIGMCLWLSEEQYCWDIVTNAHGQIFSDAELEAMWGEQIVHECQNQSNEFAPFDRSDPIGMDDEDWAKIDEQERFHS